MKVIWIVFAKEFQDIVRNRRRFIWMLVTSFIIFPVLFIAPYGLILGRATEQSVSKLEVPVQGMEHAPDLMRYLDTEQDIHPVSVPDAQKVVLDKKYPVGLIVPDDYEARLDTGESVQLILAADLRKSLDFSGVRLTNAIEDYAETIRVERIKEKGLSEEFFAPLIVEQQNVATDVETMGSQLGLIIPGLIISMGLGAGMPVAVASIAGEKKNLTLEPVLFTTVNRTHLVVAKLLAVLANIVFNLFSMVLMFGISAVGLGFVLYRASGGALQKVVEVFLGTSGSSAAADAAVSSASTGGSLPSTLALGLFIFTPFLIILFGALLEIIISTWARTDEEAYTYMTPLNFLGLVVLFAAFFLDEFTPQLWHYALPVFGAIFSMRDLLSNHVDPASLTVMFATSILYVVLMLVLSVWMFHREEVVFRT
jgi:sodium transport system permease protein